MKKRISEKNKSQKRTEKIALIGTKAGVGVTHTGILIAEFLKEEMGAKTAFLEMNHHGHIEQLEKMVYGHSSQSFSFRGVEYYKKTEKESISQFFQDSYDYLILDFGTQKKKDEEIINRCEKKILIGSLNFWEWQEYLQAVKHFEMLSIKGGKRYLISSGNQKLSSKMGKLLREKIYFLGYQPLEKPFSVEAKDFLNTLV